MFIFNIADEEIYIIPDDDYGFLNETPPNTEAFHEISNIQEIIDNNKEPRLEGTCVICLNERACYVFVPCGHLCSCEDCSNNLMHRRCPMCNLPYNNCIRTIIS